MNRQNSFSPSPSKKVSFRGGLGGSFAGSSRGLAATESFTSRGEAEQKRSNAVNRAASGRDESKGNPHVQYLQSSGKVLNKMQSPAAGGLLVLFRNHATRNRVWPLTTVTFNKTGDFALADQRGQVYYMNLQKNTYEAIRLASTGVSAMAFLKSHKQRLIVAYDSGSMVMIDTSSKEIVGNLQQSHSHVQPVVRLLRCHPSKPKLLAVADDRTVNIWDLGLCQCMQSMECSEAIVDAIFECQGQIIAVTLEYSGVYLYAMDTFELLLHVKLPKSEPNPTWTAYTSLAVPLIRRFGVPEKVDVVTARPQSQIRDLNIILAGSNSLLYSWYVRSAELLDHHKEQQAATSKQDMSQVQKQAKRSFSYMVGAIELPLKNRVAVSMLPLYGAEHPAKMVALTQEGGMLIIEIESFHPRSIGTYHVVADLVPSLLHGDNAPLSTGWRPGTIAGFGNLSQQTAASTGSSPISPFKHSSSGVFPLSDDAIGKIDLRGDFLTLVGKDGAMRMFDLQHIMNNDHNSSGGGGLTGSILRTRNPRSPTAGQGTAQSDPFNEIQDNRQMKGSNKEYYNSTTSERVGHVDHDFVLHTDDDDFGDEIRRRLRSQRSSSKIGRGPAPRAVKSAMKDTSGSRRVQIRNPPKTSAVNTTVKQQQRIPRNNGKEKSSVFVYPDVDAPPAPTTSSFVQSTRITSKQLADTSGIPLFELAALTPKEKQVNYKKLKTFLNMNGEFPSRYRPLIWRFLMKLPENSNAFSALVNRGTHPGYRNLHDRYPMQAPKMFDRLQNICSQLAHWAPIFGEAEYIPSLVFPLTLVFGTDDLASLEMSMSILMWWGHSWHVTHPNPPVHICDSVDGILKFHDSRLYIHLDRIKASPGIMGWTLISSLFTEVLSRSSWLKLMDFLVCHFDRIALVLLVPVALMRELRPTLLTADTAAQASQLLRTQQGINITAVVRSITDMLRNTPPKYFSAVATRHLDGQRLELGSHTTSEVHLTELDQAKENLALANGKPMFPLPKGNYPIYDGYPKHLVDIQVRERNRILSMSQEESRRENVLKSLEAKLHEIENDHHSWMNRHKQATEAEIEHQRKMMEQEKLHLQELYRVEEEISKTRIKSLNALENAAKEEMAVMDRAAKDSADLLSRGEQHLREKMEITMNMQKHRELAELAEIATHERMRNLQLRRVREDWVKTVADAMKAKEEELVAQDTILNEAWKREDDERKLLREKRAKQLEVFKEEERRDQLQEDMQLRLQRLQLQRNAKVAEIERARAIRLAKEQAEEALESSERSALLLRKHEALSTAEQSAKIAEEGIGEAERRLLQTVDMLHDESQKIMDAEKVHLLRQNQVRQQAKQAMLKKEWAEKSAQQLQGVLNAQGELQAQLLKLQKASLRGETAQDLANSVQAAAGDVLRSTSRDVTADGFIDVKRELETMEESVLQQQRERFREMQDFMQQQREEIFSSKSEHGNSSMPTAQRDDEDDYQDPLFEAMPSTIPAPLSGAGIGYGISSSAPSYLEVQREASLFDLPVQKAYTVASQVHEEHDKRKPAVTISDVDDSSSVSGDDDAIFEGDFPDVSLQRTLHYRELQEGMGVAAQHSPSQRHYGTHPRREDRNESNKNSSTVTARSIHEDALKAATIAEMGRGTNITRHRSTSSMITSTATARNTKAAASSMDSRELRRLAAQSLKHWEATRVMNRDEAQHDEEYLRSTRSSAANSPPQGVQSSAQQRDPSSRAVQMMQTLASAAAGGPESAAGARGAAVVALDEGGIHAGEVTTDSDTALWAFQEESP